jgi:hypothetical protein
MREGENPADRMRTPAQRVHLSPPYSNRPHKERAILAQKLYLADRRAPIIRGKQRVDLGAIDDKPGFVAGSARCDVHGMAIKPGIEQHDGAIDCHALRCIRGIGIGSAEPSSSAMSAGTKLMRRFSTTASIQMLLAPPCHRMGGSVWFRSC